jgi:hypothetical protein
MSKDAEGWTKVGVIACPGTGKPCKWFSKVQGQSEKLGGRNKPGEGTRLKGLCEPGRMGWALP